MHCGNNTRASESFSADKVLSYICFCSKYSQTRQFQVGKKYKNISYSLKKSSKQTFDLYHVTIFICLVKKLGFKDHKTSKQFSVKKSVKNNLMAI